MSNSQYKFVIGEVVQVKILDSLIRATVTGKTIFNTEPVYEITFASGKTVVKLETALASDTLEFIRSEPVAATEPTT